MVSYVEISVTTMMDGEAEEDALAANMFIGDWLALDNDIMV